MSGNAQRLKKLIRRVLRDRRKAVAEENAPMAADIEKWPKKWQDRIMGAKMVAAYMPIDEELLLDSIIRKLLEADVKMCFPKVEGDDIIFYEASSEDSFEEGSFSIREPKSGLKKVDPQEIDVMLVPGMAYDRKGTRLGRGKGYYDRYCRKLKEEGRISILGFVSEKNCFAALPRDPWDLVADAVVTETSFTDVSENRKNEVDQ